MANSLTWLDLQGSLPLEHRSTCADEVLGLPKDDWFWVNFHGAYMCSIYNCREQEGWLGARTFNPNLPKDSLLVRNIRDVLFPWMGGEGNVTIIRTEPGDTMREHIDSAANEVGSTQYKFRWVLSGDTDSLYFIDEDYSHHYIGGSNIYVINGAHPHGMANRGEQTKLTLCVGSPWKANDVFLENIKDKPWHTLGMPGLIEEWTDPRIEQNKQNALGSTYLKQAPR